ncbi:MAG: 3'-5' exoribonuclease YhaM family protein [Planctomycetota bacterium]|jgi:3'-5' exoribonuclease
MVHRFINEISAGEQIDDIYLVKDPILRSTTNGGLYIAMYICDRTGQLNGRMWQATEAAYKSLPRPGFIHINGRSELYQGNLQMIVNHFSVVDGQHVELSDFLARTDKDTDKLFAEIKQIVGRIKNEQIKTLVSEFIADGELMKEFCRAPGGVKLHHNYLGGLLVHTHNMLKVAEAVLPFYPDVQRDLVLAGIFIHDMGKTEELSYDIAFSYTDSGQLIGHVTKSLLMFHNKEIVDALGHIIISHHGAYEFGSPKLPATAEAFMVNYIDDLDAKISQVTSLIDNEPGEANWTAWQNTLQTKIYRKRVE